MAAPKNVRYNGTCRFLERIPQGGSLRDGLPDAKPTICYLCRTSQAFAVSQSDGKTHAVECPSCGQYLIDTDMTRRGAIPWDVGTTLAGKARDAFDIADEPSQLLRVTRSLVLFTRKPRIPPIRLARQNFVEDLVKSDSRASSSIKKLGAAGGQAFSQVGRRPETIAQHIPRTGFVPAMLNALALCWDAYRQGTNHRWITGIPKKSLKNLPKKLEALADDIEKVNFSVHASPVREIRAIASGSTRRSRLSAVLESLRAEANSLEDLPRLLRDYAERLRILNRPRLTPSQRRKLEAKRKLDGIDFIELRGPQGRPHNLVLNQEMRFLDLIESKTGQEHLGHAGVLLGAASKLARRAVLANADRAIESGKDGDSFSAGAVKARRDRFKANNKRTIPFGEGAWVLITHFYSRPPTP